MSQTGHFLTDKGKIVKIWKFYDISLKKVNASFISRSEKDSKKKIADLFNGLLTTFMGAHPSQGYHYT